MKFSKKIKKNVAEEPKSKAPLWLQLGVGVILPIAVETMYVFDARENQAASNPQAEHAGHHGASASNGADLQASVINGAPTGVNSAPAPGAAPEGMVWVPG